MPDNTEPHRIWNHINQSKRKTKKRYSWMGVAAGTVIAASIAGVLLVSQTALPPGGERGVGDVAEDEREREERPDLEEGEDNGPVKEADSSMERPSEKEILYLNEGTEETDTFKLLDGSYFSTYIPEHFQVETREDNVIQLHAAFSKDQTPTQTPVWTITEYPDAAPLETMAANVEENYREKGYEQASQQGQNLEYGDYAATYRQAERRPVTVVLLKQEDTIVKWEQSYPVEMGDGLNARGTVLMDEWEWK